MAFVTGFRRQGFKKSGFYPNSLIKGPGAYELKWQNPLEMLEITWKMAQNSFGKTRYPLNLNFLFFYHPVNQLLSFWQLV